MRLNAPKGQQIAYLFQNQEPWGGHDPRGLLEPGAIYTVKETIVYKSVSYVRLVEYPDKEFNTVMFEEAGELLPEEKTVMEIYEEGWQERQRRHTSPGTTDEA